jgi:hypothetical protein
MTIKGTLDASNTVPPGPETPVNNVHSLGMVHRVGLILLTPSCSRLRQ